jgi:hypothetical protein
MKKPKRHVPRQRKRQQRPASDLSRSLTGLDMNTTLIAVVELSLSSWLVAGIVPGIVRQGPVLARSRSTSVSGLTVAIGGRADQD